MKQARHHGSLEGVCRGLVRGAMPFLLAAAALWAAAATTAMGQAGTLRAWGYNGDGQLGDGTVTDRTIPVQVGSPSDCVAVAAGGWHSLALKSDGTVWAWGLNQYGQVGDGTTTQRRTPVQVSGLTNCIAVAGGGYHSLALKSDGTVWAWGLNNEGQIGNGRTTDRHLPVQVSNLTDCVALAGGRYHSLALRSDGTVWAWGYNQYGQLGDNSTTDRTRPVQVRGPGGSGVLENVVAIAAGRYHSLAVTFDGTVWAWGRGNYGQLGNNWTGTRKAPVQVHNITGCVGVSAGDDHSLAVLSDGTVRAWGINTYGRLGDGTVSQRNEPVAVVGLTQAVAVAGGNSHSVALMDDGTVRAWGGNTYGQLGDGTTIDRHTPVQTASLVEFAGLAAGVNHTVALVGPLTTYTLAANVAPHDSGTAAAFPDKPAYNEGELVTLRAEAPHGFAFIGWDGLPSGTGTGSADDQYGLVSFRIREDVEVTAQFSRLNYRLAFVPRPGGDILGNPAGDYPFDTGILLVANPDEGYRFVKWVINGQEAGQGAVLGFQMDGDKAVEAVFARQCSLTVVNGSGSGVYDEGTEVEIVADLPPGRAFDQWVGDVDTVIDVTGSTTTIIVNDHLTVTAQLVLLLEIAVEIEDQLDWVYQNTPRCLANGGHRVRLTVSVLDYGENDSVELAVTKVPGSGPGQVTVEDDPGGDPLVKYILGSLRSDGIADSGPLTLQVMATGNVSEQVAVEVPFAVRRLGDIDGNGAPQTADVSRMVNKLNGMPSPGIHGAAFDLDANGTAEPNDLAVLINILNGRPVP